MAAFEAKPAAEGRLAILSGLGDVPQRVAEVARSQGQEPFIVVIGGLDVPSWASGYEHTAFGWGDVSRLFSTLKAKGCTEVCLAGSVVRPDLKSIKFDLGGLFALPRILKAGFGGDDAILRQVISLFEEQGLTIRALPEIAPSLVLPIGFNVKSKAYEGFEADLAVAEKAIATIAPLDIGQSLVVVRQQIVAVEGAEGTDGLLARVAEMRASARIRAKAGEGVFIKAAKPGQDLRVDLPSVGEKTLEGVAKAGLAGLALQAERVLCPDLAAFRARAEALSLFIRSFS